MTPPARWTQMESPVKRAPPYHPTPVTLRLDRRVHVSTRSLGVDGFAGQAGE